MNVLSRIRAFLFSNESGPQLGLFRILLCGTLFYIACWRQLNIDQLGAGALIPRDMALSVVPDFYRPAIQWFFWPDSIVIFVHLFLIVLLGLATLGYSNRFFLLLTWVIHQGILNRNYAINFGADSIGGLFLFYLSFTNACEFYTLKNKRKTIVDDLSAMVFRLIQVQICVIYAYTGFEKLKGSTWWDGTALWTVFANPQFSEFDLKFMSHVPWFFPLGTFLTVIFEVYFVALVWHPSSRKYGLLAGVVFHLGIGFLLGLMPFSLVMISTYILFLKKEELDLFFHALSQFKTKFVKL